MSETQNNKPDEKRTPYVLDVDPDDYDADAGVKIVTSNDLCRMISCIFRSAFEDYEGCMFDMNQNVPSVTLIFNHGKHDDGKHYGVEMAGGKNAGNSVIERSRRYDQLVKEGDRYQITEDGKDVIEKFLAPRYFNNGKPNWKTIVMDYVDRPNAYTPGVQFTKIIGIDPKALCSVIWGKKDSEGSYVDYIIEPKADLSARNGWGVASNNYVLYITRASADHMNKVYEKLGLGSLGSNIIH